MTRIAVLGSGSVGGGLGTRLSHSGFEVKFGVREVNDKVKGLLGRTKGATAGTHEEAVAFGDVVFMAVPGNVAVEVTKRLAKPLAGKVLVDCNNALTWKDGPVWAPPPEGSLAQALAKAAPDARVIKGFNTFGAEFHADPNHAGAPAQVFFAGDDADAKKTFADVATKGGFRPVDAGPLRNAGVLENLAILWIHLAVAAGHGRDWTFVQQKKG
jgi:predicted dinucleotide-binding enzyme